MEDGKIGVHRKPLKRRIRRTIGQRFSKALADYLKADTYMYAPLLLDPIPADPLPLNDAAPVRSPDSSGSDRREHLVQLKRLIDK